MSDQGTILHVPFVLTFYSSMIKEKEEKISYQLELHVILNDVKILSNDGSLLASFSPPRPALNIVVNLQEWRSQTACICRNICSRYIYIFGQGLACGGTQEWCSCGGFAVNTKSLPRHARLGNLQVCV